MGSKTLTGRGLSMQSTPLGPWEVGGSAGPAGAGLQGRYCSVADPNPLREDQGGKGVKQESSRSDHVLKLDEEAEEGSV